MRASTRVALSLVALFALAFAVAFGRSADQQRRVRGLVEVCELQRGSLSLLPDSSGRMAAAVCEGVGVRTGMNGAQEVVDNTTLFIVDL